MIIPWAHHIDSKQVEDRFKIISKMFESKFQRMALIGERGGDGRTFQESFHIMCLGQGLDGKGWRSYKKEVMNKEGKEEPRKRGMIESEKREGEMTNKVEKETPRTENKKKWAQRFVLLFSDLCPSPFYWPPLHFLTKECWPNNIWKPAKGNVFFLRNVIRLVAKWIEQFRCRWKLHN